MVNPTTAMPEAPMSGLANLMAMKGRDNDSMLVHLSPNEVNSLNKISGNTMTINPATGLKYNIIDIMVCSQTTQMTIMTLGTLLPIIPGIIKGLTAGYSIMEVIDRVPEIRDENDQVAARGKETEKI